MTAFAPPLKRISREARPYPADMLTYCETGLCLFAAAFMGVNDAVHYARKGLHTTCVDTNADRLSDMARVYPEGWEFLVSDAWDFAEECLAADIFYDAVSVDTFLGDATERSMGTLKLWCSIARKCVTATIPAGASPPVPAGWRSYEYPRSTKASWLVMQR